MQVSTQAQYDNLNLTADRQPFGLPVDFVKYRLIVRSDWLTSGSIRISKVNVFRNDTTDIKQSVVYVVLPRDHRDASFSEPEPDTRAVDVSAGVLDRGSFAGASGFR